MTGRQKIETSHVWLRRSINIIFGCVDTGWATAVIFGDGIPATIRFSIMLVGVVIVVLHVIVLASIHVCPSCGNRLLLLSFYGCGTSGFRLAKQVRYCPCCALDFDKELPAPEARLNAA
jgi:hypothetical protein